MTLVMGYADSNIGFLVADSLLTPTMESDLSKGSVAGKLHGLKIQIIHPNIAIAYASSNDADAALNLIRDLAAEISCNQVDDVPQRLFEAYRHAISQTAAPQPDCEFLVLQIKSGSKELTHVTKQRLLRCTRAHIGDPEEYKKLMKLRKPHRPPEMQSVQQPDGTMLNQPLVSTSGENKFSEISDAMEDLVHQRGGSVGAIAGCIIRVVDARISKELEYMQAVESSIGPSEGRSGFSLLASNSGVRGVGIYYLSGKLGFLLIVGDAEHVRKEYAETIGEFIEIGLKKYGLNLIGGMPLSFLLAMLVSLAAAFDFY